jgi:hypothetical protein
VEAGPALPLFGTVHIGLAHEHYIAALFDDPGLLIAIRGIVFTPYLMSEVHLENGRLMMERSCQRGVVHWPAPFSPEFPFTVLLSMHPITGETELTLRDASLQDHLRAVLAPVPVARGVTSVRWRAMLCKGTQMFGNPLTVRSSVDAAALRVLKPTASVHGAELRANLISNNAAAAA